MDEQDIMSGIPVQLRPTVYIILLLLGLALIVTYFLYIRTLSRLLKIIKPENRKMRPSRVWLLLLGFLSIFVEFLSYSFNGDGTILFSVVESVFLLFPVVWQLVIVHNVSRSINATFRSRGLSAVSGPAYLAGVLYVACCLIFVISGMFDTPGFAGDLMGWALLLAFLSWVVYWAQITRYKKTIRKFSEEPDADSLVFNNLY
jgi:hypothetical protein